MTGLSTLRDTWKTQWGPAPVLALCGQEDRRAPITLPGADAGLGRLAGRTRRSAGRSFT